MRQALCSLALLFSPAAFAGLPPCPDAGVPHARADSDEPPVVLPPANSPSEFQRNLFYSVHLVKGPRANGEGVLGSAFFLCRPIPNTQSCSYVLVTARHVLEEMVGDTAIIMSHVEQAGGWATQEAPLKIRHNGTPAWMQHPTADVAAMYAPLPGMASLPMTGDLADDKTIADIDLMPGDEVFILGFPMGVFTPGAFPILRSGRLSSFPLVPQRQVGTFLVDFPVFGGNSGGPVYLLQKTRTVRNEFAFRSFFTILGLVSESVNLEHVSQGLDSQTLTRKSLGIARVVPAQFIRETIDLLPDLNQGAQPRKK